MKFSLIALFVASAIAAPQFGGGKGKSASGIPTAFPTGPIPTGWPLPTGGWPSGLPFPTGSGFPFPTGGLENDGALFNAEEDAPARPTPTGKGKGKGKGKGTGVPTGLPGFPTGGFPSGFPTGLPSGFPTGFPTGTGGGSFPTGGPDDDE